MSRASQKTEVTEFKEKKGYFLVGERAFLGVVEAGAEIQQRKKQCLAAVYGHETAQNKRIDLLLDAVFELAKIVNLRMQGGEGASLNLPSVLWLQGDFKTSEVVNPDNEFYRLRNFKAKARNNFGGKGPLSQMVLGVGSEGLRRFHEQLEQIYFYLTEQMVKTRSDKATSAEKKAAYVDISGKLKTLASKGHNECSQGVNGVVEDLYTLCIEKQGMAGFLFDFRKKILENFKTLCSENFVYFYGQQRVESFEVHLIEVDRQAHRLGFWPIKPWNNSDGFRWGGSEVKTIENYAQRHLPAYLQQRYTLDTICMDFTERSVLEILQLLKPFKDQNLAQAMIFSAVKEEKKEEKSAQQEAVFVSRESQLLELVRPLATRDIFTPQDLIAETMVGDQLGKFIKPRWFQQEELFIACMADSLRQLQQGKWVGDIDASITALPPAKQQEALMTATRNGQLFSLRALLQAGVVDLHQYDSKGIEGVTPLLSALRNESSGKANMLPWQQNIMVKMLLNALGSTFLLTAQHFWYAAGEKTSPRAMELLLEHAGEMKAEVFDSLLGLHPQTSAFQRLMDSRDVEKIKVVLQHVPQLIGTSANTAFCQSIVNNRSFTTIEVSILLSLVFRINANNAPSAYDAFSDLTLGPTDLKDYAALFQIIKMQCPNELFRNKFFTVVQDQFFLIASQAHLFTNDYKADFLLLLAQYHPEIGMNTPLNWVMSATGAREACFSETLFGFCIQEITSGVDKAGYMHRLQKLLAYNIDLSPNDQGETPLRLLGVLKDQPAKQEEIVRLLTEHPRFSLNQKVADFPAARTACFPDYTETSFKLMIKWVKKNNEKSLASWLMTSCDQLNASPLAYLVFSAQWGKLEYLLRKIPHLKLTDLTLPAAAPARMQNIIALIKAVEQAPTEEHLDFKPAEALLVQLMQSASDDTAAEFNKLLAIISNQCGKNGAAFLTALGQRGHDILSGQWRVEHVLLLRHYVAVDVNTLSGTTTPLIQAVQTARVDQVQELLQPAVTERSAETADEKKGQAIASTQPQAADPNIADSAGMTPLMHAAGIQLVGRLPQKNQIIAALVGPQRDSKAAAKIVGVCDKVGNTALHHYLKSDLFYARTLQVLLEAAFNEIASQPELQGLVEGERDATLIANKKKFLMQENKQSESIISLLAGRAIKDNNFKIPAVIVMLLPYCDENFIFDTAWQRVDNTFAEENQALRETLTHLMAEKQKIIAQNPALLPTEQKRWAGLLLRAVKTGRGDQVRWLVETSNSFMNTESKNIATTTPSSSLPIFRLFQPVPVTTVSLSSLLNVNLQDAEGQPIIFAVLERAKAGRDSAAQQFQTLCWLMNATTWQDDVRDAKGSTPLIRAIFCDVSVFAAVLKRTSMATLLLNDDDESTAMDHIIAHYDSKAPDKPNSTAHADQLVSRLQSKLREHQKAIKTSQQPEAKAMTAEAHGDRVREMRLMAIELVKFYSFMSGKPNDKQQPFSANKTAITALMKVLEDPQPAAVTAFASSYQAAMQVAEIGQAYQVLQIWVAQQSVPPTGVRYR